MERTAGGEGARPDDSALQQRIRELEAQVQGQAREIRALEKIESLQDGNRELEAENRTLREKVAELHTFLNLSKTLSATLNMEELFRLALHLIGRSLHVDAYSLMLLDEAGERLVVKAAFGLPEDGGPGLTLRLGEGISGLVAQTGQAMLVPDASAESRFLEQECFPQQHGSFICVPLRIKGREVIGVLNAQKAWATWTSSRPWPTRWRRRWRTRSSTSGPRSSPPATISRACSTGATSSRTWRRRSSAPAGTGVSSPCSCWTWMISRATTTATATCGGTRR
ncbi:MAG: GAF domain-containing protein [candidate division NC10 bacterium]|nr:GAF domain-containing protein [candidate division NC10 bacterium]